MLQKCAGACIQAFGHICEVHRKDMFVRQASFKNALVLVYKYLGTYAKFIVGHCWEKGKLQTCAGICVQAFGHVCEVYSKESSGRPASFKNALALVYKHLGT